MRSATRGLQRAADGGFPWRAALGPWRWLILGGMGVAVNACGGQAGGGSPGDATTISVCVDGVALDGGMVRCSNGMLHRATQGTCPSLLPRSDVHPGGLCEADSDCTTKPFGHCDFVTGGGHCEYGCGTDADCEPGQLCSCGAEFGECVAASCRTDAQCGGGLCASYEVCYGRVAFACRTASDACDVASDCANETACTLESYTKRNDTPSDPAAASPRVCGALNCPVPGRPFLVAGFERTASSLDRHDWCSSDTEAQTPLDAPAGLRAELVRGWTEQALMEHASVAAFARFTLQLLQLGAPPGLVQGSATAMADEVRHAQACFALARRHAQSDIGPGPLRVDGALEAVDLCSIVLGTIAEGCVGETVAALEAAEAVQHCEDATARAVLERISIEETRHAALAWQFVAWALQTGPSGLRQQVRDGFAELLSADTDSDDAPTTTSDRELARHGLLSAAVRRALRRRVVCEVVAPCAEALLAQADANTPRARTERFAALPC